MELYDSYLLKYEIDDAIKVHYQNKTRLFTYNTYYHARILDITCAVIHNGPCPGFLTGGCICRSIKCRITYCT